MPEASTAERNPSPADVPDRARTRSTPFFQGRSALLVLALITLIGLPFRLYLLGEKNLWMDEAASVTFARLSWKEFLTTMRYGEANMVLFCDVLRKSSDDLQAVEVEFEVRQTIKRCANRIQTHFHRQRKY